MATLTLNIKTARDTTEYKKAGQTNVNINRIQTLLKGIESGAMQGSIDIHASSTDPVAATSTITITHANVANADTTTILGQVITAATSGNGTTSWTIGADATADGVAMAACINANTTLSKYVTATAAAGVVTLTAVQKGSIGNVFATSTTSKGTAFAFVQWASGTGGPESAPENFAR